MYSKYRGISFLDAYEKNRIDNITKFGYDTSLKPNKNLLSKLVDDINQLKLEDIITNESFKTTEVLRLVIFQLISENPPLSLCYQILSNWIKKFEVFKKVYTEYGPNFRKTSNDFTSIEVYSLLSLALGCYQLKKSNLKFLNAQLKINDLLCSIADEFPQEHIKSAVYAMLVELDIFRSLQIKNIGHE